MSSSFLTTGTVTALLSMAAVIAGAFGKSALATFFQDPSTAQAILTVAGAGGTLLAGAMKGVK
jgi:hypothetical protein